jgi:hypothetical protein
MGASELVAHLFKEVTGNRRGVHGPGVRGFKGGLMVADHWKSPANLSKCELYLSSSASISAQQTIVIASPSTAVLWANTSSLQSLQFQVDGLTNEVRDRDATLTNRLGLFG